MPDVDLTSQFQTRQTGLNVETSTGLVALLNSVAGVQIVDNRDLNRNLKQTAISVTSAFQPLACQAAATPAPQPGVAPAPGGESEPGIPNAPDFPDGGGVLIADSGLGAQALAPSGSQVERPEVLAALRDKLRGLGSVVDELVTTLDAGLGLRVPAVRAPDANTPKCYRYQNTEHGPLGLFRSREYLQVTASGSLEFLGGLQRAQANATYIMYLEYGVNTFLNGKPAWVIDPATKQPVFDNKVVLTAQQGCTGGAPAGNVPSCGSDTVVDTLRVVVNFKKVFLGSLSAGVQTPSFSGDFRAALTSLTEQSFTGVVAFTHRIGPRP